MTNSAYSLGERDGASLAGSMNDPTKYEENVTRPPHKLMLLFHSERIPLLQHTKGVPMHGKASPHIVTAFNTGPITTDLAISQTLDYRHYVF